MTKANLESRVLDIVERVTNRQPVEDAFVELKSKWPEDHAKAARQIAGHANAARGEPILWIIGVDEKSGLTGASAEEFSAWWKAIESNFDGVAPELLMSLVVPVSELSVFAMLMATDRAPFVVKNPVFGQSGGGSVSFEVPWRHGNEIRTAKRSDLLRVLVPLSSRISVDVQAPSAVCHSEHEQWGFYLSMTVYCYSKQRAVLMATKCSFEVQDVDSSRVVPSSEMVQFRNRFGRPRVNDRDAEIDRTAYFEVVCSCGFVRSGAGAPERVRCVIRWGADALVDPVATVIECTRTGRADEGGFYRARCVDEGTVSPCIE